MLSVGSLSVPNNVNMKTFFCIAKLMKVIVDLHYTNVMFSIHFVCCWRLFKFQNLHQVDMIVSVKICGGGGWGGRDWHFWSLIFSLVVLLKLVFFTAKKISKTLSSINAKSLWDASQWYNTRKLKKIQLRGTSLIFYEWKPCYLTTNKITHVISDPHDYVQMFGEGLENVCWINYLKTIFAFDYHKSIC
jgi:hypothetical protein